MDKSKLYRLYCVLGKFTYHLLIPSLYLYGLVVKTPRPRLLFIHDTTVLLVRNWFGEQTWTLPGGGVIGKENEKQALAREIHEELGITIDSSLLTHFDTMPIQRIAPYRISIYILDTKVVPQSLVVDKREIIEATWCPLHKLPTNSSSELREIVARYSK